MTFNSTYGDAALPETLEQMSGNNTSKNKKILLYVDVATMWIQVVSVVLSYGGNLCVIYASRRNPTLPLSKLMINYLAICDLVYSTFQILFIHRRFNEHEWVFGRVMCILSGTVSTAITSSIFIVCLIAVERHRSILYPLKIRFQRNRTKLIIAALILFSIILYLPTFIHMQIDEIDGGKTDCSRVWDSPVAKYWDAMVFIFTYPCPLLTITVCYSRVIFRVRTRFDNIMMNTLGGKKTTKKQASVDQVKRQRTLKMLTMLTSIVAAFFITTTPNQAMILWFRFAPRKSDNMTTIYIIFLFFSSFVHFHSFINPIIYCISDPNFRKLISSTKKNLTLKTKWHNSSSSSIKESQKIGIVCNFDEEQVDMDDSQVGVVCSFDEEQNDIDDSRLISKSATLIMRNGEKEDNMAVTSF